MLPVHVHNTGNKGTTAFACTNYTTVVIFIYGIGYSSILSMQDNLSLYHNSIYRCAFRHCNFFLVPVGIGT